MGSTWMGIWGHPEIRARLHPEFQKEEGLSHCPRVGRGCDLGCHYALSALDPINLPLLVPVSLTCGSWDGSEEEGWWVGVGVRIRAPAWREAGAHWVLGGRPPPWLSPALAAGRSWILHSTGGF